LAGHPVDGEAWPGIRWMARLGRASGGKSGRLRQIFHARPASAASGGKSGLCVRIFHQQARF